MLCGNLYIYQCKEITFVVENLYAFVNFSSSFSIFRKNYPYFVYFGCNVFAVVMFYVTLKVLSLSVYITYMKHLTFLNNSNLLMDADFITTLVVLTSQSAHLQCCRIINNIFLHNFCGLVKVKLYNTQNNTSCQLQLYFQIL